MSNDRRTFLATTGAGLAGILAAGRAPAFAQGTRLNVLRWVDFIPACDVELKRQAGEASKLLGAEVQFEFINANDLQSRITAAIQSGSGPDIIHMLHNWPHLYENGLVEVTDVAEWQAKDQGGFYAQSEMYTKVGKRFMALPHSIVPGLIAYRKSWLDEVGATKFPDTWETYREVAKKMKAKGRPFGQTLGHTFGDAPGFTYPYMWSWGGKEIDANGKVVINSKETVDSVKFMTGLWKDGMDEGGLAWDDTNNNRAFLSQTISATLNGASIYIESLRKPDQYKTEKGEPLNKDILHAPLPKGAAGQFGFHLLQSNMLMKYSKNQDAAKEFLKWLHTEANYRKFFESQKGFATPCTAKWESDKLWDVDPVMTPYKVAARLGQAIGNAGPPNAKAQEVLSKYIITDMYAKAVQGMPPEDAVKWAESELKKVYAG